MRIQERGIILDNMTTYESSSYSLSSVMFSYISAQMPRPSPQRVEHSNPAFRQEQHRVSHPILQLYRTTFSSAFGATSVSNYRGISLPSTAFQSRLCGCRCGPSFYSPFHICTWRYTRRLWYLATDGVGGRFSGCTKRVLGAIFWWKRSNLNLSSVSPTATVYRHTSDASPVLDMSASVAFSCRNTSACVMKCLSERICFKASPFPMLNTREVVSPPRMAWANNILRQTARPSTLCTYLMFQHRGLFFVPDLTSGLKKTSQESPLTWKHRSTSRSVSSPTRVVSQDIADCTVVTTIRTYASPLAWRVSHPTCSKLLPSCLASWWIAACCPCWIIGILF